jgi:secondary thiamine-phosphate synthase enzyme
VAVHTDEVRVSTRGDGDVVDLTREIQGIVQASGVEHGTASVFVPGATAAVTAMEFELGGVHDLQKALERLVPTEGDYEHNRLNHDSNSHAHIRAAIVGPSETVPISGGRLVTGTWQQIVLLDFDDRPRERKVTVQVLG